MAGHLKARHPASSSVLRADPSAMPKELGGCCEALRRPLGRTGSGLGLAARGCLGGRPLPLDLDMP